MIVVTESSGTIGRELVRLLSAAGAEVRAQASLAIAAYQRDSGPTARVSSTVQTLVGRPPRTIMDFARDHAAAFR